MKALLLCGTLSCRLNMSWAELNVHIFQEIVKDFTLKEVLPLRAVCRGWDERVQASS